jgi:hypothetical protein
VRTLADGLGTVGQPIGHHARATGAQRVTARSQGDLASLGGQERAVTAMKMVPNADRAAQSCRTCRTPRWVRALTLTTRSLLRASCNSPIHWFVCDLHNS